MKSFLYLLPLFGALALAQEDCEYKCPLVKCPGNDAVKLCQCMNAREEKCKQICPTYVPRFLPCPINPPTTTPTTKPTATPCKCEPVACLQSWPDSCYCQNGVLERCYEKCGGPAPSYASCPPKTPKPTFITSIKGPLPTKTSSKKPEAPKPTNPVCGGGRGNYRTCDKGYTCIKDPNKPGCGPECDGLGICVKDKLCGGFAAFDCDLDGQVCTDDPRDDCDPEHGGADCGGLCMWPTKPQ